MSGGETVWLVGMMGCGKSTVGPLLAARLGRPFRDADTAIESAAGMSIPALFERHGEPHFRSLERAFIERVAGAPEVVSLGGGAIVGRGMLDVLQRSGTIVYLRARLETLMARVGQGDGRPLLADAGDIADRLAGLLEARGHAYVSADVIQDTDELSPDAVAANLERLLAEQSG